MSVVETRPSNLLQKIEEAIKKGGDSKFGVRPAPCKVHGCHSPHVVLGGVRRERRSAFRT